MTWDLDPAPFARQHPVGSDDEGAALDAADFLPVQVLQLHDFELLADRLIRVREQLEREPHLLLEALVRGERVSRYAEDRGARAPELAVQVAKIAAFGAAAGGVVLGIEVQDQRAPALGRERELRAACCRETEVGDPLAQHSGGLKTLLRNPM